MDNAPQSIPVLDEERWAAWVQKGRRGDASTTRHWRLFGAIAAAAVAFAAVYPLLFRS